MGGSSVAWVSKTRSDSKCIPHFFSFDFLLHDFPEKSIPSPVGSTCLSELSCSVIQVRQIPRSCSTFSAPSGHSAQDSSGPPAWPDFENPVVHARELYAQRATSWLTPQIAEVNRYIGELMDLMPALEAPAL